MHKQNEWNSILILKIQFMAQKNIYLVIHMKMLLYMYIMNY